MNSKLWIKRALLAGASALAMTVAADATTIGFTGSEVPFIAPVSGEYSITAWGAQGGSGLLGKGVRAVWAWQGVISIWRPARR